MSPMAWHYRDVQWKDIGRHRFSAESVMGKIYEDGQGRQLHPETERLVGTSGSGTSSQAGEAAMDKHDSGCEPQACGRLSHRKVCYPAPGNYWQTIAHFLWHVRTGNASQSVNEGLSAHMSGKKRCGGRKDGVPSSRTEPLLLSSWTEWRIWDTTMYMKCVLQILRLRSEWQEGIFRRTLRIKGSRS